MAEPEEEEGGEPLEGERRVALYDFDPTAIDWPFRQQKVLGLQSGQIVQIILDDGSEWALGYLVGQPDSKGYFPKNFTVSLQEYEELMEEHAAAEHAELETGISEASGLQGPPPTSPLPTGPMPAPTTGEARDMTFLRDELQDPELVYPGVAQYPVLDAQPPQGTTFDLNKSKLLRQMPAVPQQRPEEPAPPEDDIMAARKELELELSALAADPHYLAGGEYTDSRASTPATKAMNRPEREFVRKHMAVEMQPRYLKPVAPLVDLVKKRVTVAFEEKQPYQTDLRVRSTTRRVAAGINPAIMRQALQRSAGSGAKWAQMFRPGFNDLVNESFKVGCNACILSDDYLHDKTKRETFQKLHATDVNGTMWFELERRKEHLFYMRMEFVDVMMCHPHAWSFPDTGRIVSPNSGEPINPFHGWHAQTSIDTDKEMEDVSFLYTLRLRMFPEHTFQALSLGKIPEWIAPYMSLHAEAQVEEKNEEEEGTMETNHGKAIPIDNNLLMEAGLEDGDDMYVKLDELRLARERTTGPDVLDCKTTSFQLKGLTAMRIFLRSRGNPDNMKQALITPKMTKDMAAQLGILGDAPHYWYALFALRYPLAPEWEAIVKNDTRWYLHLPSDRMQLVHPMIQRFREHLDDCMQNEFLWAKRGFVKMKCSQCGIADSAVWCMQCTDYFCATCFLQSHRSKRGKKHWPMPIPGCRYLTASEAARLADHIPLLNCGFSNRRRFLARENQSDRHGSRSGDPWLFFHADTFQAALQQAPEKHWYLKRLSPPRLAPGVEGYFYNFANDTIADDATHILTKAHEQKAISLLQKNIRGAITRRQIRRETEATIVIQKTKVMWDVQRIHGSNGKNAALLKSWYMKYKARQDKASINDRMTRFQAIFRGVQARIEFRMMIRNTTRFQASFRRLLGGRRHNVLLQSALCIQRVYRGRLYGRRAMQEHHHAARQIQAMARGVKQREKDRLRSKSATHVQAHWRGLWTRKRVTKMKAAGLMIQTNWRRFQAQLDVKLMLYDRLEGLRRKRQDVIREKLEWSAALLIQRNWKRHIEYQEVVFMRREKGEADKLTSTMLVALYTSISQLRHYVHPWFRHLPNDIQQVLMQIKGSLQRTIALVPVTGKLANEELGRRGLRVASAKHLTYEQAAKYGEPTDLASHLLLSVSRHLLSHVPTEVFPATVKWACYTIGHAAVSLHRQHGHFAKEEIPVGKEMPAHPGDTLNTMWKDFASIKHHHDYVLSMPDESLPCMILHGLPVHHRHVFLTAEVLITMRQALESPTLSTEDHLKFQGLDASSGAQMMEVIGSELDHRLPLEWPKTYGTVATLAGQTGTHVTELKAEKKDANRGKSKEKDKEKDKGKDKEKEADAAEKGGTAAKTTPKANKKGGTAKLGDSGKLSKTLDIETAPARSKTQAKVRQHKKVVEKLQDRLQGMEESVLSHFSRVAYLRVMQQVGYLMRDQDRLVEAVLTRADDLGTTGAPKGQGVRQSHYISVTDKLFEMANRAEYDHCAFVLAVVIYHMVLRGLLVRLLYHRAAVAVQKRYRYVKVRGQKANAVGPAICIQRFWRGLRAALLVMRKDGAASTIQHSWKAWRWNRRSRKLLAATLKVQRVWHGAVQRKWLQECHGAARFIQKIVRGFLVRVTFDRPGRDLMRRHQDEMSAVLKAKSQMSESMFIARTAAIAAKARVALHKHRERNLDLRRMKSSALKSRHGRALDKQKKLRMKGSLQPVRLSIFEPMVYALKRLNTKGHTNYGAPQSRVMMTVQQVRRSIDRSMPKSENFKPHAGARRGRAAMRARRLAKKPKVPSSKGNMLGTTGFGAATVSSNPVDDAQFEKWLNAQFAVR